MISQKHTENSIDKSREQTGGSKANRNVKRHSKSKRDGESSWKALLGNISEQTHRKRRGRFDQRVKSIIIFGELFAERYKFG